QNAMWLPSGDQAGASSAALLLVNLRSVVLARDTGAADVPRRFRYTTVANAPTSKTASTAEATRTTVFVRRGKSRGGASSGLEGAGATSAGTSDPSNSSLNTRAKVCFSMTVVSPTGAVCAASSADTFNGARNL